MELKRVLTGVEGLKARGNLDLDILGITIDSREVKPGYMFIAVKGYETDGHKYITSAIQNGAKVLLVDEDRVKDIIPAIPTDMTLIATPNTRKAIAVCACNFYDNPSRKVKLIGITGTKGKTTTSFMIKEILEKQGIKTGLIGTIAIYSGDVKIEDSERTTPDAIHIQYLFSKMVQDGCQAIVMEVSSQSLKLHRVDGCYFDIGVFTNFSEDHIGEREHPNLEDYFNSKVQLFNMCSEGFINTDDLNTIRVPALAPNCKIKTYGIDNVCDILAKDITITNSYVDFRVKVNGRNERIKTYIPGRFSVYNSLAAICIAERMGCSTESIKTALEEVRVPGRSELVNNNKDLTLMIDYAHSPESLRSILQAVKTYTRGRVISVFGCGGDRDKSKRPQMGEISGNIADYTIITSDNPRTEDPNTIIKEIEEGIKKTKGKYECIVDRTEAIRKAIKMANKLDIVVFAGKGHETYQEINKQKYHYDEREIIKGILNCE